MTLAELQADCYRRLGYPPVPQTPIVDRITGFLNETQEEILARPGMSELLHGSVTFDAVTEQAEYALPALATRIRSMRDLANQIRLRQVSESFYRFALPDPSVQTGTSYAYALLGIHATYPMPAFAINPLLVGGGLLQIAVTSTQLSGALNDAGTTAHLEVVLDDFSVWRASALIGAGHMFTFPPGRSLHDVTNFYLSAPAVGTVTLSEFLVVGPPSTPEGHLFAAIPPGAQRAYYQRFALIPTPSGVITYVVDIERELMPMVNPGDSPVIPKKFHRVIAIGARKKEYEFKGDGERRDVAESEWIREVGFINDFLVNPPDQEYIRGRKVARASVLGPWFPSQSYLGDG